MKKRIISALSALTFAFSALNMLPAYAESNTLLYFKSGDSTDIVKVSAEDVQNGDVTLRIEMYIDDSSDDIGALRIRWKSDSEYISLGNLLSPFYDVNDETEYTLSDGTTFSTSRPLTCFGKVSNNKYKFQGQFIIPDKPDESTGRSATAYSISYQSEMKNAVKWFDGDSDAYMISDFDAVLKQGTPEGLYKIYYIEPKIKDIDSVTDEEWNSVENGISYGTYYSSSKDFLPDVKSITVQVGEPCLTGDVNQDNVIDASDSSLVLSAYAGFSSGKGYGLTQKQLECADVNHDGSVDSSDASRILEYYANISSGKSDSLEK